MLKYYLMKERLSPVAPPPLDPLEPGRRPHELGSVHVHTNDCSAAFTQLTVTDWWPHNWPRPSGVLADIHWSPPVPSPPTPLLGSRRSPSAVICPSGRDPGDEAERIAAIEWRDDGCIVCSDDGVWNTIVGEKRRLRVHNKCRLHIVAHFPLQCRILAIIEYESRYRCRTADIFPMQIYYISLEKKTSWFTANF